MASKLTRLQITEVALLPEGASEGAKIVFAKSREGVPMSFDINTIPEQFRGAVQAELDRRDVEIAKAKEAVKAPEPTPVEPELPATVQKRLAQQEGEIMLLRKSLEERDEREFVAGFTTEFANVPEVQDIAKSVYTVRKSNTELADHVTRVLRAATAISKKVDTLTVEKGKSGNSESSVSALAALETIAKGIQETDKVPYAVAFAKALSANPDLYNKYNAERPSAPAVMEE